MHAPLDENLVALQVSVLLRSHDSPNKREGQPTNDTILKMKDRYARLLPLKAASMERLATAASISLGNSDETGARTSLLELMRICHNLKGSGATYGFSQVSLLAGNLEKELKPICQGNGAIDSAYLSELTEKLALLSQFAAEGGEKQAPMSQNETQEGNQPVLLFVSNASDPRTTRSAQWIQASTSSQASHLISTRLDIDAILVEAGSFGDSDCLNCIKEIRDTAGIEGLPFGLLLKENHIHSKSDTSHAGVSLVIDPQAEDQDLTSAIDYLISLRADGRSKVIVVDDDEDFLGLVSAILKRQGFLVRTLQDPTKALDNILEWGPDLIMLDINMPFLSGFELCKAIRIHSRLNDTPIIFLTAQTDMSTRIAAFEAGADDYLPKPVAEQELISRVKVRLDKSRMVKRSLQLDPLTGLLLRKPLMDKLETFKNFSIRNKAPFSVALADIDHFKEVNDTHGHLIGDEVLKTFARIARSRFRAEDLRGRWGGEEFIFAFRGENMCSARKIVERFLFDVKATTFKNELNESFTVSFSSGVAEYPTESATVGELLKLADKKLYRAKATGRSRVLDE
ncbi:MAG: diguanylate cyclase [Candidatus Obscuribacter sp.]|nr:diguanylate cyclase [Candidatus Obscuribacter sp.]